jgi:hypothetical protein
MGDDGPFFTRHPFRAYRGHHPFSFSELGQRLVQTSLNCRNFVNNAALRATPLEQAHLTVRQHNQRGKIVKLY